jgi:hypothetical protein
MAVCASSCVVTAPVRYTSGCGVVTRNGGIKALAFIACDYEFTDITDAAEWATAIGANNVVLTGELMAELPRASPNKKRVSSCSAERTIGYTRTIAFVDYNTDPNWNAGSPTTRDTTFWNTLLANPNKFKMAYYTCDGAIYGVVNDFTIDVSNVIPSDNTDVMRWEGTIEFTGLNNLAPAIVDLNNLI